VLGSTQDAEEVGGYIGTSEEHRAPAQAWQEAEGQAQARLIKQATHLMSARGGHLKTAQCAKKLGVPVAWLYYNVGSAKAVIRASFEHA
jgi:hypothetical protein